ncbi:hypothetical protein [Salipiger sp.]|uniref:hypothetical protein n=1 Tax=Salipiger sp. TaxID=2078585 RepID=UPI003A98201C
MDQGKLVNALSGGVSGGLGGLIAGTFAGTSDAVWLLPVTGGALGGALGLGLVALFADPATE